MARFWCKVCDEPLRTVEGAFVATCAACGARQALPQSLDEEYLQHFGELCRMRQNGDIEGAHALVNAMLDRFSHEAALYWQRVLVTYEAKYRQESGQCEYVLECGRAAPTPVLEHVDYQKALSFSSAAQRAIYEEDARLLERSRRILCGESYVPDVSVSPLNSGFLCLEDGEWDAAMAQFDSALEEQPQNALAYFGKMMAELHVRREAELPHVGYRLPETENHRYVLEYGDDALRERLHHHWETGLLAHAVELCGKATSVDDWKRVKKLLQQIPENQQAQENITLCDMKIREIMVREAQVIIGCREAADLGLTTETLGVRVVNANYYYDFDMADSAAATAKGSRKKDLFWMIAIVALLGMIALAIVVLLTRHLSEQEISQKETAAVTATAIASGNVDGTEVEPATTDTEAGTSAHEPELCMVGNYVFDLQEDGTVRCLSDLETEKSTTTEVSGASFSGNFSPYASDWSTWKDVAALYSDPTGAMLFGVMKNGTVAYDIFSTSEMTYEAQYSIVATWRNVQELIWDDTGTGYLFARTKDGDFYAVDETVEKAVRSQLKILSPGETEISDFVAEDGTLHFIMENGTYLMVTLDTDG